MPSTIVTTTGGTTSNSYISASDARTYFDNRLDGQSFIEASSDDQARALITAATRLNDIRWFGSKADGDQALAWPRGGVVKRDSTGYGLLGNFPSPGDRSGYGIYDTAGLEYWPSDEIPQFVKDAQCLLALAYLQGFEEGAPRIKDVAQDGLTIKREFAQPAGVLPAAVLRLIGPYIVGTSRVRA